MKDVLEFFEKEFGKCRTVSQLEARSETEDKVGEKA
jgi:hypothetical protein